MAVLFLLLVLPVLVGVGTLLYWLFKRLGYARTGRIILGTVGILYVLLLLSCLLEDLLFFKKDAKALLLEQNIRLTDDFELLKNESMSAIGDYYHTFTLSISEKDKQRLIRSITSAPDFNVKKDETWIDDPLLQPSNRHKGGRTIRNYATKLYFITELIEAHGDGYAPTFRKIKIDRKDNTLVFEDIDE